MFNIDMGDFVIIITFLGSDDFPNNEGKETRYLTYFFV
jgi:hypothetical protein